MQLTGKTLSIIGGMVLGLAVAQPGLASDSKQKPAFDWMANGTDHMSDKDRLEQARLAIRKARALNGNATWVCSPAGFGQRSQCQRG